MRATTSASNLHRRVRCPGSHWAEHGLPEEDSEQSKEGTLLHAALEKGDEGLQPAQADLVRSANELIDEVITRTVVAFAIEKEEPFEEGHERELLVRSGIRIVLPGHCDRWRYYPGRKLLIIADAKFGFVEVTPAPLNLQLRAYAAGGAQEWDVETCIVAIAQPRAFMTEGAEKLTIARYDRADLDLATKQIIAWEAEWKNQQAPRRASEDACRYCKARATCSNYTARIVQLTAGDVAGIADLSPEAFVSLFEALRLAKKEDFQEVINNEARVRVAEGRLPGYKLKPNSARRLVINQVQAAKLLRDKLAFDDDDVAAASKVNIGEVESVLRTKEKFKAKDAKTKVNDALESVIELNTPEPSIVPVSEHDAAKTI